MNTIDYEKSKLSIFAAYIRPHKAAFLLDMTLSLFMALVDLTFPYLTRHSMNTLLPEKKFAVYSQRRPSCRTAAR